MRKEGSKGAQAVLKGVILHGQGLEPGEGRREHEGVES